MSLPFNITNPGIYISGLLTSGEASLVSDLAALTPSNGDSFVFSGGVWTVAPGGSGATTFTALTDTPANYTGHGGKAVIVKGDETGIEFTSFPSGSGDVVGPAVSVNDRIVLFNGTTGKLIKDSGVTTAAFATAAQGALADTASQPGHTHAIADVTGLQTALDGKITAFADPNADRIVFWDDSANAFAALTASTGLTLSGTNLTVRTASTTQTGIAETATDAEAVTGTDTSRYVTPSNLTARLAAPGTIGGTTPGAVTGTTITSGTELITPKVRAGSSSGILFEANGGADVALFGAGDGQGATFYGGVNIDGTTRLATSLTGFLRADAGVVSIGVPTGSGDVVGPASATDNAVARFDSTTGKIIQNSTVTIGDSGNIETTIPNSANVVGLRVIQNDVTNNRNAVVIDSAVGAIATDTSQHTIVLRSTSDSSIGPYIGMYHDSASPAVNDQIGGFGAFANDGLGTEFNYGGFGVALNNVTDTTESARIDFFVAEGGNPSSTMLSVNDGVNGITVGKASLGAGVVESSGDNDIVIQTGNATTGTITIADGANGNITIAPNGNGKLYLNNTGSAAELRSGAGKDLLISSDDGAGGIITLFDGANGNIEIEPNGTGAVVVPRLNYIRAVPTGVTLGNLGATETINWASGRKQYGTLDSNITITFSNAVAQEEITLFLTYSGAQRTITWPAITWLDNATGAAPTAPSASGNVLVVTISYDGTTYYGSATGNYSVYS